MNILRVFSVLTLVLFSAFNLLFCQNCAFIAIENAVVTPSEQACVDIQIVNDHPVIGFSGVIFWDEDNLSFSDLSFINPELGPILTFNENEVANGLLRFLWSDLTLEGEDLIEPIFTICFDPVGNLPSLTSIELGPLDPTPFEIIDTNYMDDEICYQPGIIEVVTNSTDKPLFSIAEQITHANCFNDIGGEIFITPFFHNSPLEFTWTGPNNFASNSTNISQLESGMYHLLVEDQNGIEVSKDFEVLALTGTIEEAIQVNKNCATLSAGEIDLNLDVNDGPFIINWSHGATSEQIIGLGVGVYEVTVTSSSGCQAESSFEMNDNFSPVLDTLTSYECNGMANGAIEIMLNPDLDYPVNFAWSNGATTQNIANLVTGNYSLTVSDNFGCNIVLDFAVPEFNGTYDLVNFSNCATNGMSNGLIIVEYIGGANYSWSDGSQTSDWRLDLVPGIYNLTVTDSDNGCIIATEDFNIENVIFSHQKDYFSCELDTVELNYETDHSLVKSYNWYPAAEFSDSSIAYPLYLPNSFDPNDSIQYSSVLLESDSGCYARIGFELHREDVCVWPGDANDDSKVDGLDLINIALINDEEGPSRIEQNTDWLAQPSFLWNVNIPGTSVNGNFADCDGNGIIEALDTNVVIANYGNSHFRSDDNITETTVADLELSLNQNETLVAGNSESLDLHLNHIDAPAENVYGLYFQLTFDPSLIQENSFVIEDEGWLAANNDIWSFTFLTQEAGKIDVVMTRTDRTPASGNGKIAAIHFTTTDSNVDREINFDMINTYLFDQEGNLLNASARSFTGIVYNEDSSVGTSNLNEENNDLVIYPNPTGDFISFKNLSLGAQFQIFNNLGELVGAYRYEGSPIPVFDLNIGIYTVRCISQYKFHFGSFVKR